MFLNFFSYSIAPIDAVFFQIILLFFSKFIYHFLNKFDLKEKHKIKCVCYILEMLFSTITLYFPINSIYYFNRDNPENYIELFKRNIYFANIYYTGNYVFELIYEKHINISLLLHHLAVLIVILTNSSWLNQNIESETLDILKLTTVNTIYATT